ncbi:MAG: hypothetical protein J1E61_00475 [Lachnospiraceae bacterium]|nr:hypothetical protein [Lachnospiraceae bacterium]
MKNEMPGNYSKKIFTLLLVLYPILSVYLVDFKFTKLSCADTLLLILLPLLILKLFKANQLKVEWDIWFILIWCLFHFLIVSGVILDNVAEVFRDECHFMLVLFLLAVLWPNIFDPDLGIKALIIVSVISSIFLIIQFVLLHLFNVYLPGQLQFFESLTALTGHIRPFSFFSEPAAFGVYNSIGLAAILLKRKFELKYELVFAGIVTAALVLSTSTTSLGLMVIAYLYWLGADLKKRLKYLLIFGVVFLPVVIIIEMKYSIFLTIYQHSFAGLFSGNYAHGLTNRVGELDAAMSFHSNSGILVALVGTGMISLSDFLFLPTIGRINIYYGILGYVIFAVFFIKKFIKADYFGRTLFTIAIIAAIFSETVFGIAMLWYMPYALIGSNKTDGEK